MKPSLHFDPAQTTAQSPSHDVRRLLCAQVAVGEENLRSGDVPSAYPDASGDKSFRVTMTQPRRFDGTFTEQDRVILINCVQKGSRDGGYL